MEAVKIKFCFLKVSGWIILIYIYDKCQACLYCTKVTNFGMQAAEMIWKDDKDQVYFVTTDGQ